MRDVLLISDDDHAEIGQATATDKDIGLAWARIKTFLWKHVGPTSPAPGTDHATVHQDLDQVSSTAIYNTSEPGIGNETPDASSTDGAKGASNMDTTSSAVISAGA